MICKRCGAVLKEEYLFCGSCGEKVKKQCTNCGKELSDGDRFCPSCGKIVEMDIETKTTSLPDNRTGNNQQYVHTENVSSYVVTQNSNFSETLTKPIDIKNMIEKNAEYYLIEFQKIEQRQKTRFNWAAFLLGPGMCFYRKCNPLFKKYFLVPYVMNFIALILCGLGMESLMLLIISIIALVVSEIFISVNAIRFGFAFNKDYYEHCQLQMASQNKEYGVSLKNMILFWIFYLVIWCVFSVIIGIIGAAKMSSYMFY